MSSIIIRNLCVCFYFQSDMLLKHLKGLHDCVTLLDKQHEIIVGVVLVCVWNIYFDLGQPDVITLKG